MAYPTDHAHTDETRSVILEKLQIAFWTSITDYPALGENATFKVFEDPRIVHQIIGQVISWMLDGHKVDRLVPTQIDFPATWWDHWKQDHGPKWLVKRWPVEYKTITVTKEIHQHYVCPHINAKDDRFPHIGWMYKNSGQYK